MREKEREGQRSVCVWCGSKCCFYYRARKLYTRTPHLIIVIDDLCDYLLTVIAPADPPLVLLIAGIARVLSTSDAIVRRDVSHTYRIYIYLSPSPRPSRPSPRDVINSFTRVSFCIPRRSLCHRTVLLACMSALRLSAFPLRVFPPTPSPLQRARTFPLFFHFPALSSSPNSFSFLPRSLVCRPFVSLSILLDYVFFSRVSFLFLIPLSFSPVHPSLPRRFAIFLCFCIFSRAILHLRYSFSLSLARTFALYFSAGLACPFPFLSSVFLHRFCSTSRLSHSTLFFRSSCIHSYV